jgi:hypothetical protein
MADDDDVSLGPWANADLGATARADAGIGADDGLPKEVRFVTNVAKLIRTRRAQPDIDKDPRRPAVFLLQPVPPELEAGKTTKRIPMLDNGITPINGRIWFVGAGPASGRYVDYDVSDDDELFRLVTDALGQGSTPAVLFDPRLPVPGARYYPRGLGEADTYETLSVSDAKVDLDEVLAVIEKVYQACLVTPEAQTEAGRLWHNHDKWWPSHKAEAIVQLNLKAGLVGAFPTCTVRHEQTIPEGRLDLEIEQSDPLDRSKVTRHAIIELKILRSFGETGAAVNDKYILDWVKSGIVQAASYRDSKNAKWAALFCFDMRKTDTGETCFHHVLAMASSLSVFLKRWFLYAKSAHYRAAMVSSA